MRNRPQVHFLALSSLFCVLFVFSGSALFEEHSLSDSGLCRNLTDIYPKNPFTRKDGTNVRFLFDFVVVPTTGFLLKQIPPTLIFSESLP